MPSSEHGLHEQAQGVEDCQQAEIHGHLKLAMNQQGHAEQAQRHGAG